MGGVFVPLGTAHPELDLHSGGHVGDAVLAVFVVDCHGIVDLEFRVGRRRCGSRRILGNYSALYGYLLEFCVRRNWADGGSRLVLVRAGSVF